MKKNTIFVDCFNTIILRNCSSQDVIYDWATIVGQKHMVEPTLIYKLFNKARFKLAIRKLFKYGYTEVRLDEILLYIAKTLIQKKCDINIEKFCEQAKNDYILAEKQTHSLNDIVVKKLIEYKKQGKHIYLVSDFYCPKDIIALWLKNLNIYKLFDDLFVSCDFKRTKSSGKLYTIVRKRLHANKKDIIMIGDNGWSDIWSARIRGISAYQVKHKAIPTTTTTKQKAQNCNNWLEYNQLFNEFNGEYNLSNYAFPLFLFTKRLYNKLKQGNVHNVIFLSREGQFLKQLFDKYCKILTTNKIDNYASQLKTHYLIASRNSVLCATNQDIEHEDFKYLFRASNHISIKGFLQTLNFNETEIKTIKDTLMCDINKKIRKFSKSKSFALLKQNAEFKKLYENKRKNINNAFGQYLNAYNIDFYKEGMHIVDIGYKGTMQALISKYFDNKVNITGYYIGNQTSKFDQYSTQKRYGLLYAQDQKIHANKLTKYQIYQYEQICRANHNSCASYTIQQDIPTPILMENPKEIEIFKNLTQPLQQQILHKFERIAQLDYYNCNCYENLCAYMYFKLLKRKTKKDWDFIMSSQDTHQDNFGDERYPFKVIGKNLRLFGFKALDKLFIAYNAIYANIIKKSITK